MSRFFTCILFTIFVLSVWGANPKPSKARTAKNVKTEQQATSREISETKAKLNRNALNTRRKLDELNDLSARIDRQIVGIDSLNARLVQLDSDINATSLRVASLGDSVTRFRQDVKNTLKSLRTYRRLHNSVAFVFAANSFNQAFKRGRYLSELNAWRTKKIARLRDVVATLEQQKNSLVALRADKSSSLAQLSAGKSILESKRASEQQMINDLRRESTNLNTVLKQKQKRMRELENELDRIIAEQQRRDEEKRRREEKAKQEKNKATSNKSDKPAAESKKESTPAAKAPTEVTGVADADRQLSGSFAANRGKLLFPVAGKYTIVSVFGRSHHRTLSNIEVNNSGIDIAVAPGTTARAVYGGTVSSVFFMNGFQNIVIVRHGEYLTVYAGLVNLKVKKGQDVKTGTPLGTVFTNDDNGDSRTVLHFEVRREREKLNPMEWVR